MVKVLEGGVEDLGGVINIDNIPPSVFKGTENTANPNIGDIVFNLENNFFEAFDGSEWVVLTAPEDKSLLENFIAMYAEETYQFLMRVKYRIFQLRSGIEAALNMAASKLEYYCLGAIASECKRYIEHEGLINNLSGEINREASKFSYMRKEDLSPGERDKFLNLFIPARLSEIMYFNWGTLTLSAECLDYTSDYKVLKETSDEEIGKLTELLNMFPETEQFLRDGDKIDDFAPV